MKRLCVFLASVVFVGINFLQAQTVQITGTVTSSEDGLPVPGASVLVKGTTIGASTDLDGKYSIGVPQDAATLVVRFVGFKTQEIEIGGRTSIDVVLESEMLALEEIVVTALGITKEKKALGYTVQEVSGDDLVKAGNPNIMTAISGKVAGVDVRQSSGMPGAPSQIYVRGARAFSGNNAPLYVVDGMPISSGNDYASNVTGSAASNRALDIDPNDIESINVLKGQAAAALYGLRASNGVIIITTKKGANANRPVVSFSSNFTIDNIARLPEVQQKYAQGTGGSFAAANSFSWGPLVTDLPDDPNYGGNNFGQNGKFFDPYKNEWVTPQAFNNPENFYNRNGYTWNNSINVSNSTDIGNYSVGFGSTSQEGIIRETGMERYTAKLAGDFKLAEKWTLGFAGNYSDSKINKLPSGNDSWLFTVYGAPPSFDLMGTPSHQEGTDAAYRQISYRLGAVGNNPNWVLDNNSYDEATKRFFGNSYLQFKPAEWVTLKYQIGLDTYTTNNSEYQEMGTGDLPTAAQYPSPTNPNYAYVAPTGGVIDKYGLNRRVVNSLFTAVFTHEFNENLSGSLLLGNEIDHNASEFYVAYGSGFTTPGWNNLSNTNTQQSSYNYYQRRTFGVFANASLDYMRMLFFNATARQDVVSSMPRDNRTFFYPSASLAFVFTELEPLKDNSILSFGKARISYAEVGQAADTYYPNPYFVTGGASSGFLSYGVVYPFNGVTGYKYSSIIYDPNLVPQNTRSYEFGLDLRFLNNRIGVDYSYYMQNTEDQIFGVPMAGSTGYSTFVTNAGKMSTYGHEIVLSATPVKKANFTWDFAVNFTKAVSKVEELAPGVESISLGGYVTPNIRASAGDTYPAIYGDMYARDDKGRILVDDQGLPYAGEFGKIGDVSPDFILGFSNTFNLFKYVTVFGQLEWKQGGQIYSGTNRLMDLYGTSKRTEDRVTPFIFDGYKEDGTPNDIERGGPGDEGAYYELYANRLDAIDEAHIYETSYVKLREVAVNVALPNKWVAPANIERASVGFVMRNVLLWTTLPYFDPETSQGQGNMQGGMDYMSLPQTTSYGFSLNFTF